MTRRLLAAIAAGLALAVSACGEEDEPADAVPPRSAADYRAAADAACVTFARENDRLVRGSTPENLTQQAALDTALARAADAQTRALDALAAPADLARTHDALVANHRENADAYRAAAGEAQAGDADGHAAATRRRAEIGNEQLRISRELGLQDCARVLPEDTRTRVEEVTRRVLLGTDPARSCDEDVTAAFLQSNLSGTRAACREVLRGLRDDGATVDVESITGVDRVIASANVRFSTEGGKPAKALTYDLVWEDGAWRLQSAFDPGARAGE